MIIYNKDIITKEKILITIAKIKKSFLDTELVSVLFSNDVEFVNPFFLILLLNLQKTYKNNYLVIDLTYLKMNKQYHIHRFLIQFIDFKHFDIKESYEDVNFYRMVRDFYNRENIKEKILEEYKNNQFKNEILNKYKEYKFTNEELKSVLDDEFKEVSQEKLDDLVKEKVKEKVKLSVNSIKKILSNNEKKQNNINDYFGNKFKIDKKNIYEKVQYYKEVAKNLTKEINSNDSRKIRYLISEKIYEGTKSFVLADKNEYNILPIMELTNGENIAHRLIDAPDELKERNIKYDCFLNNKNIEKNEIKSQIKKMLQVLGVEKIDSADSSSLENPLSEIFFEIIDNIKKHTLDTENRLANASLCFFKNQKTEAYELVISDDYEMGLLKSYLQGLFKEKEDIETELKKFHKEKETEIIEQLSYSISLLERNKTIADIEVLEQLFDINKTFSMHQIPRIIMHFGIPSLVKLMRELKGELHIFVNRKEKCYKIEYKSSNISPIITPLFKDTEYLEKLKTENKFRELELFENIEMQNYTGTHYIMSFPINAKWEKPNNSVPLKIDNINYQEIFKNRPDVQNQMEIFSNISSKELFETSVIETDSLIVEFSEDKKIGDFIREVYRKAYLNNIQDILITSFPIDSYSFDLIVLSNIIYSNSADYESDVNVAFLDNSSLSVVFIGGKTKEEFCFLNQKIQKQYNYHSKYFQNMCEGSYREYSSESQSNLFIKSLKDPDRYLFLPIELIKKNNKYLLGSIVENYLQKNKIPVHVDTRRGYHINSFYKFNLIFEDSQWTNRIAFILANQVAIIEEEEKEKEKKSDEKAKTVKIIGTDKYTNLIISLAYSLLEKEEDYIVIDSKIDNDVEYIHKSCSDNEYIYLIYSSVNFTGQLINNKIINEFNDKCIEYKWFSAINLIMKDEATSLCISLVKDIELTKNDFEKVIEDNSSSDYIKDMNIKDFSKDNFEKLFTCKKCRNRYERPLYKIDKTNSFTLEFFNEENYFPREDRSFCKPEKKEEKEKINWLNSIYFGHVTRGSNHYAYYTRTISFFIDNKPLINKYLSKTKKLITSSSDFKEKDVYIFAPMHQTNNKFITFVDKIVFDNNATIYHFDKNKDEQNFFALENIKISSPENVLIYYVDDEISSGSTFRYLYSLLKMKNSTFNIDGILTLINRLSPNDEYLIHSFLNNENHIYSFCNLEISPIKTELKKCFLCYRKEEYLKMLDNTSLDLNRFQIAKRVVKLKKRDFIDVDYNRNIKKDFETKLKSTIKMLAVDYISRNFNEFTSVGIDTPDRAKREFNSLLEKFQDVVFENVNGYFGVDSLLDSLIKKIINYESEIALYKAMSFPKTVYFEKIRNLITFIVIEKLKEIVDSKRFSSDLIQNVLKEEHIDELRDFTQKGDDEQNSYLKKFLDKKDIDFLNFLYRTAGYLNINCILDQEHIILFHKISQRLKSPSGYDHNLLHIYPFAVKMVILSSAEKTTYFKKQLHEFIKFEEKSNRFENNDFTIVHGLMVETFYTKNKEIFLRSIKERNGDSLEKRIGQLRDTIINFLEHHSSKIEIRNIFINENIHMKYSSYNEYIEASKLRDILNNFEELNKNIFGQVDILYKGAIRDVSIKNEIRLKPLDDPSKIDNTWSNDVLKHDDGTKSIIIKLVDIDKKELSKLEDTIALKDLDKTLWIKPIGCLVISYSEDFFENLQNIRLILSIQSEIVNFLKNEFNNEKYKDTILLKKYEDTFLVYNHTTGSMFDVGKTVNKIWKDLKIHTEKGMSLDQFPDIEYLKNYFYGISKIARIGQLKNSNNSTEEENNLYEILTGEDVTERFRGFFEISKRKHGLRKINLDICSSCGEVIFNLDEETLLVIFFEFFYNAIKYCNLTNITLNIKVFYKNNELIIKNNYNHNGDNINDGLGIAQTYIQETFENIDYSFEPKPNEKNYQIIIKGK